MGMRHCANYHFVHKYSAPGVIFQLSTYHQGLAIIEEVKLTNGS